MALTDFLTPISSFLSRSAASIATLAKCMILSKVPFKKPDHPSSRELIILGNGPSLPYSISSESGNLADRDFLAVNFAPNTQLFLDLRPGKLVIADPHFFHGADKDEKVRLLWKRLASVSWPLSLYVPAKERKTARRLLGRAAADCNLPMPDIQISGFNLTPASGFAPLRRWLYDRGLAMPRPRNVLIPSLMIAIREGYKNIRLLGADHSWSRTLWVDDQNRVVSIQPHFYPDDEKEKNRVASEYAGYHLHDIYSSLAIAFRSYFDIADYASRRDCKIVNSTPGSFIDAFPRS